MPQLKSKHIQKCKNETYATLKLSLLHCDLPWCLNQILDISSSTQVPQCLGSGSELRKSSGWSEGAHQ